MKNNYFVFFDQIFWPLMGALAVNLILGAINGTSIALGMYILGWLIFVLLAHIGFVLYHFFKWLRKKQLEGAEYPTGRDQ